MPFRRVGQRLTRTRTLPQDDLLNIRLACLGITRAMLITVLAILIEEWLIDFMQVSYVKL